MDIFKIIAIGLIGAIIVVMLKAIKSDLSIMATLATGIIIVIITLTYISDVIVAFNQIVDKTGLNSKLFSALLKIVGIGYLTEYSSGMCEDMGSPSLGKKIQFSGKIAIFLMAIPVVTALINTVANLLK